MWANAQERRIKACPVNMGSVNRVLLALLLLIPAAAAHDPSDAAAVWSAEIGDGTATISVSPAAPKAGEQFVALLELETDLDIASVTYQMCDVGQTCFAIGYPVPQQADGSYLLATADEWMHSEFMADGELRTFAAGERIGWQYFIELADDNGTVLTFPHGEECDVFAPDDEWLACQESHYFAVDIEDSKSTPVGLLLAPAALLIAGRRRA